MEGTSGSGPKPQRTREDVIRSRGVAILMQIAMPVLHDRGSDDDRGRATRCKLFDVYADPEGRMVFVLDIADDDERDRIIGGEHRLHLSALQILFSVSVRDTFPVEERQNVNVIAGIRNPGDGLIVFPQELVPESELDPLDPEDEDDGEEDGDA